MLKINGKEIENVKFNGVDLDKVVINGVNVFEKTSSQQNTITMRTLQDSIRLNIKTKDFSPCEVWNAGDKIGVLNSAQATGIPVPNKNEDVIIKGKNIISLVCPYQQLTSLNVQDLNNLQFLSCNGNLLTSLNVQGLNNLQYLNCYENQLASLNVQDLNQLQHCFCNDNHLTSLNVQGLNNLQYLDCYSNLLTAQAFTDIFNSLRQTNNGRCIVYKKNDDNYKDFTSPYDLVEAFNGAKARGWKFYKNDISDSNLI